MKTNQIIKEMLVVQGPIWIRCAIISAKGWLVQHYSEKGFALIAIEIGGIQFQGYITEDISYMGGSRDHMVLVNLAAPLEDRVVGLWHGEEGNYVQLYREQTDAQRAANIQNLASII